MTGAEKCPKSDENTRFSKKIVIFFENHDFRQNPDPLGISFASLASLASLAKSKFGKRVQKPLPYRAVKCLLSVFDVKMTKSRLKVDF